MKRLLISFLVLFLALGLTVSAFRVMEQPSGSSTQTTTTIKSSDDATQPTTTAKPSDSDVTQPDTGGDAEPTEYTLSGVYGFRDNVSYGTFIDSSLSRAYQALNFSLYGNPSITYSTIGIDSDGAIYYGNDGPGSAVYSPSNGWCDSEHPYIDLGDEPQTVSVEFYNWFTNATRKFGN